MRKISQRVYNRLIAQAAEAEHLELTDLSDNIRVALDVEESDMDPAEMVEKAMWVLCTHRFDDAGVVPDAREVQELVEDTLSSFSDELTKICNKGLPGEDSDEL